jgi:hypothetical protein
MTKARDGSSAGPVQIALAVLIQDIAAIATRSDRQLSIVAAPENMSRHNDWFPYDRD